MREVIFLSKFCFPLAVLLGLPPFCVDLCSFSVCTFLSCLSHSYFLHSKKIKVPNSSRLDPYSNDITLAIYPPPPHTHSSKYFNFRNCWIWKWPKRNKKCSNVFDLFVLKISRPLVWCFWPLVWQPLYVTLVDIFWKHLYVFVPAWYGKPVITSW